MEVGTRRWVGGWVMSGQELWLGPRLVYFRKRLSPTQNLASSSPNQYNPQSPQSISHKILSLLSLNTNKFWLNPTFGQHYIKEFCALYIFIYMFKIVPYQGRKLITLIRHVFIIIKTFFILLFYFLYIFILYIIIY